MARSMIAFLSASDGGAKVSGFRDPNNPLRNPMLKLLSRGGEAPRDPSRDRATPRPRRHKARLADLDPPDRTRQGLKFNSPRHRTVALRPPSRNRSHMVYEAVPIP